MWLVSYLPAPHAVHIVFAAFTIEPGPQDEQTVWLVSYMPASHAEQVVFPELTIEPPPQLTHAVTVPVVEYVPASHALCVVAPLDAGHLKPPGHDEHVALVATPAAS